MAEDSKSWMERIRQRVERAGDPFSPSKLDEYARGLAIFGLKSAVDWDRLTQEERNKLALQATEVALKSNQYQKLRDHVEFYSKRDRAALDERRLLRKIENGQGLRTLFWRTLTTLVAVSIVFGAYALAAKYQIPLPLSRLQLNGA